MTLDTFYESLGRIEFDKGTNVLTLEEYLLACLSQLEKYKHTKPSYELFLLIYDQARNGSKVDYNLFWKKHDIPKEESVKPKFGSRLYWKNVWHKLYSYAIDPTDTKEVKEHVQSEEDTRLAAWESVRDQLRSLAVDLIHTRKVRGEHSDKNEENEWGEWFTESGEKFYNGNTPFDILKYAANRFTDELDDVPFAQEKITWQRFLDAIWIGIKYE